METFNAAGDLVDYFAKANFRALGKRFGKQTPVVAEAVASADAAALAAELAASGVVRVTAHGVGARLSWVPMMSSSPSGPERAGRWSRRMAKPSRSTWS